MFDGYPWEACSSLLREMKEEGNWGRGEIERGSRRGGGKEGKLA